MQFRRYNAETLKPQKLEEQEMPDVGLLVFPTTLDLLKLYAKLAIFTSLMTRSYNKTLDFQLFALRFRFTAGDTLRFPRNAANMVRGGLGAALRSSCADPLCSHSSNHSQCPYARLFEPRAQRHGPSGLANWPRPFVLRTRHLDQIIVPRGAAFEIGVNLFDLRPGAVSTLEAALARWAQEGVGPSRASATLTGTMGGDAPERLTLDPLGEVAGRVMVRFITPTELKGSEGTGLPAFELLMARIRDRLSTLSALYGAGPLPIDFRSFIARAASIKTISGATRKVVSVRRSRSTGQTHSLGGFVGEVVYEGEWSEFLPFLNAATFTGVGRQTVWGKGEIGVEVMTSVTAGTEARRD